MKETKGDQSFLKSLCGKQWKRIGLKRRAGVTTPLFSIYSSKSIGIGELPDLKLLADWCRSTGMSLIQLLPMNDVGLNFRPYDAHSSFALEPMYLALEELMEVNLKPFRSDLKSLRQKFPPGPPKSCLGISATERSGRAGPPKSYLGISATERSGRAGPPKVHYGVKAAKQNLLWQIFRKTNHKESKGFKRFLQENKYWLRDYTLFKVIKEKNQEKSWEMWEEDLKTRKQDALEKFEREHQEKILFHAWLQWQLYGQFQTVKKYAAEAGVFLMGDLPFLVSRDSADVWSHQDYFKLDFSAGAPPDAYVAKGQRWGMPPYHWQNISRDHYDYLVHKLHYAQNFYDLFRIDHVVGIFRLWTIPVREPLEHGGLNGFFDPSDEKEWEEHGRKILSLIALNTTMLPCAEDLGVVPECSYRVLEELGMPGMDVQRWMKHWGGTYEFKSAEQYRVHSIATLSSHDMSSFIGWWEFEAGTVDEDLFKRKCESRGIVFEEMKDKLFDLEKSFHGRLRWRREIESVGQLAGILGRRDEEIRDFIHLYLASYNEKARFYRYLGWEEESPALSRETLAKLALERISASASIFSVQLLQDWFSLDRSFEYDPWDFRINFPGTMNEKNWTLMMPWPLEKMKKLTMNRRIKAIHLETKRT